MLSAAFHLRHARCSLLFRARARQDEATSALDAEAERAVQAALDAALAAGGHTVLLVAHRLSTVRDAHLIAVCGDGRILEQGTHEQLLAAGSGAGVYAKLVARQLEGSRRLEAAGAAGGGAFAALAGEEAAADAAAAAGGEIEALLTD